MKKLIAMALVLGMALTLCACGGQKAPAETPAPTPEPTAAPAAATPAPTPPPTPEPTEPPTVGDEPVTGAPEGSVIFDRDGLKITTAGLDVDPSSWDEQAVICLDVENSGSADACLGVVAGAVNGFMTDVYLLRHQAEDGEDYSFEQTVPAGETARFALCYNSGGAYGVDLSALAELSFSFTLAEDEYSWPDYTSARVTIETGEKAPDVDIAALGTVVIDNDKLLLVFGEQDYDDYLGPEVQVYLENRTDSFIGISADTAEADGVFCDYVYGSSYAAPRMRSADFMCFDGDVGEMKGFEELSVVYSVYEAETYDGLNRVEGTQLDPVSMTYPPQIWGEYENGGRIMEIAPKYDELVTVEAPAGDPDGILFTVSEIASLEAGGYEGAGWLFSIAKISADRLHEMLCRDMSGAEVFARDYEGGYYMFYTPTDVRYERATLEEMQRDADQWSMLCEWADDMKDRFIDANSLERETYGNSVLEKFVARAAWDKDTKATIAFLESYGEVSLAGVDGTPYADFILHGCFWEDWSDELEAPDGEYMVLNIPEENMRIDFFWGDPSIARITRDGEERLCQATWYDDNISYAEAVHGWYYAAAEKAGLKEADTSLDAFLGGWHEKIAGRGTLSITRSVAPGKVNIYGRWPSSAATAAEWELVGFIEEGELFYENGHYEVNEYDENGDSWNMEWSNEESGRFYLNAAGELCWHNDSAEGSGDSEFVR